VDNRYEDSHDNKSKTLKDLTDAFIEKWGEKRDHHQLLATLNLVKKNENETMDEFNKRFNELVSSMHTNIKPPDDAILIYYVEAFVGEMRYQLRDKEPLNLKSAQEVELKNYGFHTEFYIFVKMSFLCEGVYMSRIIQEPTCHLLQLLQSFYLIEFQNDTQIESQIKI
jgi:hypothetical protein